MDENNDTVDARTFLKLKQLKPFACNLCQKEFFSKIHYQIHSVIHLLPEHFNCDECEDRFTQILTLDEHLEMHKNRMCIICNVCKKEFFDIASLNKHAKIHTNKSINTLIVQQGMNMQDSSLKKQKPIKCDACNKEFFEKHQLAYHYQICSIKKKLKSVESEKSVPMSSISKNTSLTSCDNDLLIYDAVDIIENSTSSDNSQIYDDMKRYFREARQQQSETVNITKSDNALVEQKSKGNYDASKKIHDKRRQSACHNESGNKNASEKHVPYNSLQNLFICDKCNEGFSEKCYLDMHYQSHCISKQLKSNVYETLKSVSFNSEDNFFVSEDDESLASDTLDMTDDAVLCDNSAMSDNAKSFASEAHKQQDEEMLLCPQKSPDIKQFICKTCCKVFPNKRSLTIHFSTHSREKTFNCQLCGRKFNLKCLLYAHLRTHTVKKFFCSICQKGFVSKDHLFNHIHTHAIVTSFPCNACKMTFSDESSLEKHIFIHSAIKHCMKSFKCEMCQKVLSSKQALKFHMYVHMGLRPYVCKVCSKAFADNRNLRRHYSVHSGENLFTCKFCGAGFTRSITLSNHQRRHHLNKTETHQQSRAENTVAKPCNLCPKGNIIKRSIYSQDCIHVEKKPPLICEICQKSFSTMYYFRHHQYLHSGETPYVCEICNKGFHRKQQLKCHQYSHSGKKPFSCDVCGKAFVRRDILQEHVRIHTGEKPFMCDVCYRRFTQRQHLKYHLENVHGKKVISISLKDK